MVQECVTMESKNLYLISQFSNQLDLQFKPTAWFSLILATDLSD